MGLRRWLSSDFGPRAEITDSRARARASFGDGGELKPSSRSWLGKLTVGSQGWGDVGPRPIAGDDEVDYRPRERA